VSATEYLKQGYARRLTPSPEGGFTATIQEFPGLVAEGDTAEEAVRNLESAAHAWIDSVLQSGHEVPPPVDLGGYSGKIALRLPRGLHKRAAEMASTEGVSLNQWLVSSVAHYLGTREALQVAVDNVCARILPWTNVGSGHTTFFYHNSLNVYVGNNPSSVVHASVGGGLVKLENAAVLDRGFQCLRPPSTSLITKS
jgi:predicted RNase H-like HicB family nuclease